MAKSPKKKPAKKRPTALQKSTPKKGAFLAAFAQCANIARSARCAGVSRDAHYKWKAEDAEYARQFKIAAATAYDGLEEEAHRRAVTGLYRLKFHEGSAILVPDPSGRMVPNMYAKMILNPKTNEYEVPLTPAMVPYVEHQYSDTLLIFLLKAARPKKFRDNAKIEHTGNLGVNVTGETSPLPSPEELAAQMVTTAAELRAGSGKAK